MRPGSPEGSYINNIDRSNREIEASKDQLKIPIGFKAENALKDFFEHEFTNYRFRKSTSEEDSGHREIVQGKQIDAVLYDGEKPLSVLQITTAKDNKIRTEKLNQLKQHSFIRLAEMKPQDVSIPKALIYMPAEEVELFIADPDWAKHPKLKLQILQSLEISYTFDLMNTKNPKEISLTKNLLSTIQDQILLLKNKKQSIH